MGDMQTINKDLTFKTLKVSKKEKEKIGEFVKRIKEEFKGEILHIFLFGSFARNEFKEDSDIDILIVLKRKNLRIVEKIYEINTEIYLKYGGAPISLKIFDKKHYEFIKKMKTEFFKNLKKEKISL